MTEGDVPGRSAGQSECLAPSGVGRVSRALDRPWVGIAANPGSGRGRGRLQVERLGQELERLGLCARVAWSLEERSELVAESSRDTQCRCLVAAGGDGTVAALVNERPRVPITVLPAGTENLFARHFGLGQKPERLAAIIAEGHVAPLDVGQTDGRRFTLMAGIGFDADVVTRHHIARVGRAGVARPTHRGAYVESVLRSTFEYRFPTLEIRIDDPGSEETLRGSNAFLFNLPRYALGLPFAPRACGDDGWLDLIVFRDPGAISALRYLWMVLRGSHLNQPGVEHRSVRRIVVSSSETVPFQLDGDPGGYIAPDGHADGPRLMEVIPRALEVMVPA